MTAHSTDRPPLVAHFVGSMPFASSEKTFRRISAELGEHLRRLPDGETGDRTMWVGYVGALLNEHPDLEADPDEPKFPMRLANGHVFKEFTRLRFRPGVDPRNVRFSTRYAAMARESFKVFDDLQRAGVIPPGVRFQVSLPTPFASAYNYISRSHRTAFVRAYTRDILAEVEALAQSIPPERLAVQWDVLQEILAMEGYFGDTVADFETEIFSVLAEIGDGVPEPVELGVHYCYGSPLDQHLIVPEHAGTVVRLMKEAAKRTRRPISYFHIPVPQGSDAAYFEPLKDLEVDESTRVYMGLIQENDSEGNHRRLSDARRFCRVDGLATECGMGRASREKVDRVFDALRELLEQ